MTHQSRKPYTVVGANRLIAPIFKTGDEDRGWVYHFYLQRDGSDETDERQRFYIDDVGPLLRLTRLIAFELSVDGCMTIAQRKRLQRIAQVIDKVVAEAGLNTNPR